MPRKVSFSTLREVTVNIEDTVSEAGEARPPPNACEPNNPRRAGALVYLLLLAALAGATSMEGHTPLVLSRLVLENGVLDLAVSRIDPAAAAAGGGGYYSYSEP